MKNGFIDWINDFKLIRDIWVNNRISFPTSKSISILEKSFISLILFLRGFSLIHIKDFFSSIKVRSEISEFYQIAWLIFLTIILLFNSFFNWIIFIIVVYRIIDSINYRLAIIFVDRLKRNWGLRSINRSLILLLINFLEIVIGFSILYVKSKSIIEIKCQNLINDPIDAFYYSLTTIATLGTTDFMPSNQLGRVLIMTEVFLGLVFIGFLIGIFLSGINYMRENKEFYNY